MSGDCAARFVLLGAPQILMGWHGGEAAKQNSFAPSKTESPASAHCIFALS
jgi:hypothetical protein